MTHETKTDQLLARDTRVLGDVLKVRFYPLAVSREKGCTITDVDGNEYLDFMASWAVANAGYGTREVLEPVMDQMQKTSFASLTAVMNEPAVQLGERLIALMPGDFRKKVWYGLHGSDATDALSKLVPMATKRPRLVSYIGGFHGQTGGSAALSGHTATARVMGGGNVTKVPYPYPYRCLFGSTSDEECGIRYLDYIENYIFRTICPPEDTAGIIIEPIQSDGGDIVPPDNYLPGLEELCRRYGIMLLVDEVKVGFGRTGRMFGFQNWGITPDAVAMGKSIGSGVAAMSAVVGRAEILDAGTAINMYSVAGNPVSCTAGLATLDYIEKHNLMENAHVIGDYLLDGFKHLQSKHPSIGDVRGKGMILGVELVHDRKTKEPAAMEAAKVVYRCKELGLILFYGGIYSNVLEITPPLIMTREQADKGLAIIDQALEDVEMGRFPDEKLGIYAGW